MIRFRKSNIGLAVTIGLLLFLLANSLNAQTTTTFTYQGELKQNGELANGLYDMEFELWNSLNSGSLQDSMTVNDVEVVNGRFHQPNQRRAHRRIGAPHFAPQVSL